MQQNELLAKAAVRIALENLGQKELTGQNDGVFVRALQRWLANGAKWMDGQPWCATFATWCIYKAAGLMNIDPIITKNGSSTSIYSEASRKGFILKSPVSNCIGLIRGSGGVRGKTHHHTFFVLSVDKANNIVYSIDGNWKNAVTKTAHRISDCDFVAVV